MASSQPLSPGPLRFDFKLPMPPPLIHTRSGNVEPYDRPFTPDSSGFISPSATPQGSPSKKHFPPGAHNVGDQEFANIFDKGMKLEPSTPTRSLRHPLSPTSPTRSSKQAVDDSFEGSVLYHAQDLTSGNPLGRSNKENAEPGARGGKDGYSTPNHAALSRQEPYQTKDTRQTPNRGLTAEELEKLQLPKVKRLANVTQLCE